MSELSLSEAAVQRLLAKIEINDTTGCHIWTASVDGHGYGQFSLNGRPRKVHQILWCAWGLEVPEGLELDHVCKTKRCCNPLHLELVTHQENIRRAYAGKPFRCGHSNHPSNIYIRPSNGQKRCRICKYAQELAAKAKR